MVRTTVYVDEDVALALRHRASIEGKSQAELIREALRRYVEQAEHTKRPPIPGMGRHRSGRSDVSARAEDLLRHAARAKRAGR
jgi:hypothetical protein